MVPTPERPMLGPSRSCDLFIIPDGTAHPLIAIDVERCGLSDMFSQSRRTASSEQKGRMKRGRWRGSTASEYKYNLASRLSLVVALLYEYTQVLNTS